jgi:hypothetical protein
MYLEAGASDREVAAFLYLYSEAHLQSCTRVRPDRNRQTLAFNRLVGRESLSVDPRFQCPLDQDV